MISKHTSMGKNPEHLQEQVGCTTLSLIPIGITISLKYCVHQHYMQWSWIKLPFAGHTPLECGDYVHLVPFARITIDYDRKTWELRQDACRYSLVQPLRTMWEFRRFIWKLLKQSIRWAKGYSKWTTSHHMEQLLTMCSVCVYSKYSASQKG